jgi:AbrB family looped-hinge helix DNA binding protein
MSIVRVQKRGQVTLPTRLRARVGITDGDLLEAKFERGKITLAPKSMVDREIAEGLEDVKKGRTHGPYDSAEEMISSLHRMVGKSTHKARKQK